MPLRHNPRGDADGGATGSASAMAVDPGAGSRAGSGRRIGDEAILDAARHLVVTQGMERTTLTDVAREAGLSRMTVYRRWSGLPELLGRMMQREWDRVLTLDAASLAARMEAAPSLRGFMVDEIVGAAQQLRGSELLQRILTAEPHLILPYLVERAGSMHRFARQVIANGIEQAQGSGQIRAGDPDLLATTVVLTVQSWVVSLQAGGDGQSVAALDEELRLLLDRYLAPDPPPQPRPTTHGATR